MNRYKWSNENLLLISCVLGFSNTVLTTSGVRGFHKVQYIILPILAQAGVSINAVVSHVNVQVITVAQCQATFGAVFVQASTICTNGAGGVGICGGDSGGPLIVHRNGVPILVSDF